MRMASIGGATFRAGHMWGADRVKADSVAGGQQATGGRAWGGGREGRGHITGALQTRWKGLSFVPSTHVFRRTDHRSGKVEAARPEQGWLYCPRMVKGTEVVAPRTERRGWLQGVYFKKVTRIC